MHSRIFVLFSYFAGQYRFFFKDIEESIKAIEKVRMKETTLGEESESHFILKTI